MAQQRRRRALVLAASLSAIGFSQPSAQASDFNWKGLNSSDIMDAGNWDPNGQPAGPLGTTQANIIHFGVTSGSHTPTMPNGSFWPNGMFFDSGADAYTFLGTAGPLAYLAFDSTAADVLVNN